MLESLAEGLGSIGGTMIRWSAIAFLIVNGAAVAAFFLTRSRALVNRWTPRLVAINVLLLGTGVGVPAVTYFMKAVVQAVSSSRSTEVRLTDE